VSFPPDKIRAFLATAHAICDARYGGRPDFRFLAAAALEEIRPSDRREILLAIGFDRHELAAATVEWARLEAAFADFLGGADVLDVLHGRAPAPAKRQPAPSEPLPEAPAFVVDAPAEPVEPPPPIPAPETRPAPQPLPVPRAGPPVPVSPPRRAPPPPPEPEPPDLAEPVRLTPKVPGLPWPVKTAPPRKPVVIPAAPPKPPGQSDRDRTKDLAEWARRVLPADFNIVLPPRRRK
jgi:outer membrane biosynthesis protein TonB